jgi:hypothetical protein
VPSKAATPFGIIVFSHLKTHHLVCLANLVKELVQLIVGKLIELNGATGSDHGLCFALDNRLGAPELLHVLLHALTSLALLLGRTDLLGISLTIGVEIPDGYAERPADLMNLTPREAMQKDPPILDLSNAERWRCIFVTWTPRSPATSRAPHLLKELNEVINAHGVMTPFSCRFHNPASARCA